MRFSQQFNKEDDLCLLQLKLQESSEFYSAGLNAAEKFANGIAANTYLAVARASEMAAEAAAAAGSGIEIQPTIRPVLDLFRITTISRRTTTHPSLCPELIFIVRQRTNLQH